MSERFLDLEQLKEKGTPETMYNKRAHVTRPLVSLHNLTSQTIQNGGAQCWILALFGKEFQWDRMHFRS